MFEGTCTHEVYVLKVEVIFFFLFFFFNVQERYPAAEGECLVCAQPGHEEGIYFSMFSRFFPTLFPSLQFDLLLFFFFKFYGVLIVCFSLQSTYLYFSIPVDVCLPFRARLFYSLLLFHSPPFSFLSSPFSYSVSSTSSSSASSFSFSSEWWAFSLDDRRRRPLRRGTRSHGRSEVVITSSSFPTC